MGSCVSEGTAFLAAADAAQADARPKRTGKRRHAEAEKGTKNNSLGLQAAAQALIFLRSSEALLHGLGLLAKQRC